MEPFGYALLIAIAAIIAAFNYYARKAEREYRATLSDEERKRVDDEFEEISRM